MHSAWRPQLHSTSQALGMHGQQVAVVGLLGLDHGVQDLNPRLVANQHRVELLAKPLEVSAVNRRQLGLKIGNLLRSGES